MWMHPASIVDLRQFGGARQVPFEIEAIVSRFGVEYCDEGHPMTVNPGQFGMELE
jgi:hypothetical protein